MTDLHLIYLIQIVREAARQQAEAANDRFHQIAAKQEAAHCTRALRRLGVA